MAAAAAVRQALLDALEALAALEETPPPSPTPRPFLRLDLEDQEAWPVEVWPQPGETLQIELKSTDTEVSVTVARTTANGTRTESNGTVTMPGGQGRLGRVPTEPVPEPPPPPPPPEPGVVPGWNSWGGEFFPDGETDEVEVVSTGLETGFTMNTDEGLVDDTVAGRVYTATVRIKAGVNTAGRTARLVWRERATGGNVESQSTVTLTGVYQTVTVEHTATQGGRLIDLRISVPSAAAGDSYIVEAVPAFDYEDPDPEEPTPTGTAFDYPFDPLANINQRIDGLALRSDSAAAVTKFNSVMAGQGRRINTFNSGEAPPIYLTDDTMPLYTIAVGSYEQQWRFPSTGQNGGGSDYPLCIWMEDHPVHGEFVEIRMWQASINHTTKRITATNYGLFRWNNDGRRLDGSRRSVGRSTDNNGGRGAGNGLTYTAGIIRPQEVIDGEIRHALRMAFGPGGQTTSGNIGPASTHPPVNMAIKSDQAGTGTGVVPMGTKFRLKSTVDPDTRTVPGKANTSPETRFLRIMCRALQRYGLFAADGSGGVHGFYMENSRTAAWGSIIGESRNGHYGWILRDQAASDGISRSSTDGIPWNDLEVVVNQPENL